MDYLTIFNPVFTPSKGDIFRSKVIFFNQRVIQNMIKQSKKINHFFTCSSVLAKNKQNKFAPRSIAAAKQKTTLHWPSVCCEKKTDALLYFIPQKPILFNAISSEILKTKTHCIALHREVYFTQHPESIRSILSRQHFYVICRWQTVLTN